MNIGDRVRVVKGREEGIITGVIDSKRVEVAIDGDFRIPFFKTDLVVVSDLEAKAFGAEKEDKPVSVQEARPRVFATEGIYLSFVEERDYKVSVYLVNNTDYELHYVLGEQKEAIFKAFHAGVAQKKTAALVSTLANRVSIEDKQWVVQILYYNTEITQLRYPLHIPLHLQGKYLWQTKSMLPILNKEGYLTQLDKKDINPNTIQQALTNPVLKTTPVARPEPIIDLHIEKLVNDAVKMKPDEILRYQIRIFEGNLEKALSSGMKEITFIHGVGNGVLKQEIHRKLSANMFIKYFQDAQKDKFGYGATFVCFK